MALEMREVCERCGRTLLPTDPAYICSYECTFCPRCAEALGLACRNCQGELAPRPRREPRLPPQ